MSLLSSDALLTNDVLRRRVDAAIRAEAAPRRGGAPGTASTRLAREAYHNPGMATASFLLRLASNLEIVSEACEACGHAGSVPDDTVKWIVGDAWDEVAAEVFGEPDAEPAEPPAA